MSVRYTSNVPLVQSEKANRVSLALRFMLEAIHRESLPNTPMQHGNLRADVVKSVNGYHGEIRWSKNYAAFQEEKRHAHYTTPGTGPHFARNAVQKVMKNADTYVRKAGL